MTEQRESFEGLSLKDSRMRLPSDVQELVPEAMLDYYQSVNKMHCEPGLGGSKYESVSNVMEALSLYPDLAAKVEERVDDREALLAAGAPESAFLPAVKGPDSTAFAEALYYKVENVEGHLGIIQLKDLPADTRILVRREKGHGNPDDRKNYVPVSFTAIRGTEADMPKTDFGTVIVGREGGEEGEDVVWTTHPGAPIRSKDGEYDWSTGLLGPKEVKEGEKQPVMVMTIDELKEKASIGDDDYIKLVPGDLDAELGNYEVL